MMIARTIMLVWLVSLTAVAADGPATNKAWLAYGLYTDVYGIADALKAGGLTVVESHIRSDGQLTVPLGNPSDYRVVVICNVPARLLDPVAQHAIREYVQSGGGLMIFGGNYGYGYGGMQGSFLAELLPVEINKTFDLLSLKRPQRVTDAGGNSYGQCLWVHQCQLRDGAQPAITVRGHPFLVTSGAGQGRVVTVLGTVLGEMPQPFWESPNWKTELQNLVGWCAGISRKSPEFVVPPAGGAPSEPPWGTDFFPDGSFEKGTNCWTLAEFGRKGIVSFGLANKGCAGQRCLALASSAAAPETYANADSPLIPAGEGWYVVSFWARWDAAEPPKDKQSTAYLDRYVATAKQSNLQDDYLYFPMSREWQYAFRVVYQRPGRDGFKLRIPLYATGAGRLLIDRIQLRKLNPPRVKHPPITSVITASAGYGGELVDDADAKSKSAWKATSGKFPAGAEIMGPIRKSEEPGLYEVVYRLKQETPGERGLMLEAYGDGGGTWREILPSDFQRNGKYQEFTLYFLYPFGRGNFYTWYWRGAGAYAFDQLEVRQLAPLTQRDSWNLLYEGVDVSQSSAK
jgi:hypothetical protein